VKRLFAAAVAAGLLSACAGVAAPGATRSETPRQSLTATGKAMSQLTSARFDLNGTVDLTLPQALVDQLKAKGSPQTEFLSSKMRVGLKITGAAARNPDRADATITATLGGLTISTEVIAAGGNLYYRDPMTGKWESLKKREAATPNNSTAKFSYQEVLDTAKSITDLGTSEVNNTTVDHYRVVPNLVELFDQASAGHAVPNPSFVGALRTVLQNASLTVDIWTGTSDHLIRRLSYDLTGSADLHDLAAAMTNGVSASAPAFNVPAGSVAHLAAHVVIDLHDFNSRVNIAAPTAAS
jgi:hypothetical protein